MSTRPEPLIAETAPIHKSDIYREFCQTHINSLRNWAEKHGITRRELAKLISLHPRTLAKWMSGETTSITFKSNVGALLVGGYGDVHVTAGMRSAKPRTRREHSCTHH